MKTEVPAPQGAMLLPASILVVDDTLANLQVLSGMLKERGYKVRPVPSGKLAIQAAQRDPPELILLDINMPDMNGYEVCQHLKKDQKLKGVPVIFISALTEPLDKVKAFATGGVDYITKPFQMEELHARVETHLKLRRLQVELERSNKKLATINERMSADLKAAAKIQKMFLPRQEPAVSGALTAWSYRPCDELGGDGLNVIRLDDRNIGLYILDVSGHGVSAALLSVTMSRLLSPPDDPSSILLSRETGATGTMLTSPAAVADHLNRLFPFDLATQQFATLMYGIFDVGSGVFRYVSAGHPGPLVLRGAVGSIITQDAGAAIGVSEQSYAEQSIHLAPGDRLYLYSDGLPEALNSNNKQFGDERLVAAIERGKGRPLQETVDAVMEDVALWHDGAAAQDDHSVLALELDATK